MADKVSPKIEACDCRHEFQDRVYGKGQRVKNPMQGKKPGYRCTVCQRETLTR